MKNGTTKIWGYKLSRKNKTPRKKAKKNGRPGFHGREFFPHIAAGVALAGILVLCVMLSRHYFLNSETFSVKHISVNKLAPESFRDGEAARCYSRTSTPI